MPVSDDFAAGGIAVRVCRAVNCVDVDNHNAMGWKLGDQDATLEIPVHGPGRRRSGDVASNERTGAVDSAAKAGGIVFVSGETEVDVVEAGRVSGGVIVVRRAVDGSADRGFR